MKTTIFLLLTFLCFQQAMASENCAGKIELILDHPSFCNNHAAFSTTATGGKWVCSISDLMDTMILIAQNTGQTLNVRLSPVVPGDCTSINHYTDAEYASFARL